MPSQAASSLPQAAPQQIAQMAPEAAAEVPQQPPPATQPPAAPMSYEETFGIKPTTAAGIAGAVTRGAAPVAMGALGGGAVAGPPGAVLGAGVGALAPLVLDPAVEAVNRLFGTNLSTPSQALNNLLTKMGVAVPETAAERGTETVTRGVTTGIAGPAGVGRLLQTVTAPGSVAARTGAAIEAGGMGPTGAAGLTGFRGAGVRAGAGGTSGLIGGMAAEGTPAGATGGAIVGALTPGVAAALKGVALGAWDSTVGKLWKPTQTAEQALFNSLSGAGATAEQRIAAGEAAFRGAVRGMQAPGTPGVQRSLTDLLMAGGVEPTNDLAALAVRLERAGSPISDTVRKFQEGQISAIRQQLSTINDQLRVPMLTPGRRGELESVRDNLIAQVDAEEAILRVAERTATESAPGAQLSGQAIAKRAEELSKGLRETLITPAYKAAFESAGAAKTNIDGLVADAERVLGRPLSDFAPDTAPPIVRRIAELKNAPADQGPRLLGPDGKPFPRPARATLEELDSIRKAINATIADARRGTSTLSGVEVKQLQDLHSSVDRMVRDSTTFSVETKQLYDTALKNYRDIYVPRFREGETARMLKPAMFGEMRIEPDDVVKSFLAKEGDADQFIRTFAGDPVAFNAMRDGIISVIRKKSLDGFSVSPKKLQSFLAENAPILKKYEDAGMNLRGALHRMEQEATQADAVFKNLETFRGPFSGKTPDQILRYITEDPSRMKLALDRSNDVGKDTIRRVGAEQLNEKLQANPQFVLNELSDQSKRAAYRMALPESLMNQNLIGEFEERAKLAIAGRDMLKQTGKVEPDAVLRRSNLTLPQLQALRQAAETDIARIRRIDELASKAGATPRLADISQEVAQDSRGVAVMPSASLSATQNIIIRSLGAVEQRVNRRVNAELARMLYENPQAGMAAIDNAIKRAQAAQRPARAARAAPAVGGVAGAAFTEERARQLQPER
jgi:hypothetical protein